MASRVVRIDSRTVSWLKSVTFYAQSIKFSIAEAQLQLLESKSMHH